MLVVNCHFSRGKCVCVCVFLGRLGLTSHFHIFINDGEEGVHSKFLALLGSECPPNLTADSEHKTA